jgi:GNAT superfamily N-acetyltransferase
MKSVLVRPARPEELDEAGRITLEAYREYEHEFPPDYWEPYAVELANARRRAEVGMVVVAEIDGRLVGAAALRVDPYEADTVYLQMVAADPGVRRAGIGLAIMDYAFEYARRQGAVTLKWNTVSFMHPARKLYTHLGYEPEQEDPLTEDATLFTYRVKV